MLGILISQALNGKPPTPGRSSASSGLSFVGGVLIPFSTLPHAARVIGQAFPSYDLAAL